MKLRGQVALRLLLPGGPLCRVAPLIAAALTGCAAVGSPSEEPECEDSSDYVLEDQCGDDADCDGLPECAGDCDDTDPTTRPGAPEQCDWVDHNCDGIRASVEQCPDDCAGSLQEWAQCQYECPSLDRWLELHDPENEWWELESCGEFTRMLSPGNFSSYGFMWDGDCELIGGYESQDVYEYCFNSSFDMYFGDWADCSPWVEFEPPACAQL